MMNIVIFLVIGLLSGWIASNLIGGKGLGVMMDLVVGVIGAFVGGYIFQLIDITVNSVWGEIATSVIGAVVFLLIVGMFQKRSYELNK